jgi:ABC-type lipoprotein release transport system permease subunit
VTVPVIRRYLYDDGLGAHAMAFLAAAFVIALVASLAAIAPAYRALRIDPARTVRYTG